MNEAARVMIVAGLVLVLAGVLFLYRDHLPLLKKIGSLPGDIRIERENVKVYIPIMTSLLLSAALSLILYLFRK